MFQHAVQQVHFAVVRNGYDRRQVDADVLDYERQASEARTRMDEAEKGLAEVTERARALEAKISALQTRSPRSEPPGARPVSQLARRLLETVSAAGRELPAQVLIDAERDRSTIERGAADVREDARTRAAAIVGSARRDQQRADSLAVEARRQIDHHLDKGRSIAEERAQAVWDEASARLHQPALEVEQARRQGRAVRRQLKQLQDLRDECWQRVARHPERRPPRDLVEDLG
jgi:chromosome segregation ATPase